MSQRPAERHDRRYCLPDPLAQLTDATIVAQIPAGSRVLDLGCGNGRLLAKLRDTHGASIQGIELDRQAMLAEHADYRGRPGFSAFSIGAPTVLKKIEIWKLKPTNQGFREAQKNHVWEPITK